MRRALLATALSAATAAAQSPPAAPSLVRGAAAERVDAHLSRLVPYGYSGAVALSVDGRVVLAKGYGLADRARRIAFDAGTAVPTGSIAKAFTRVAIVQLAAEGRLGPQGLGAELRRFFPDAPANKAPITVQQLLDHRAGLPLYHAPDDQRLEKEEFLRRVWGAPLRFAPGARQAYSNTGYGLLAAIIERVTGRDYESVVKERVFQRAGMRSTGWRTVAWPAERVAHGYGPEGRDAGTMLDLPPAADGGLSWSIRGAGGFLTTAGDLVRFREAIPRLVPAGAAGGDWLGGAAGPSLIAGGDGITETVVGRLPGGEIVALSSSAAGAEVAGDLVRAVGRILRGETVDAPPAVVSASEAELARAAGTWAMPSGARLRVRAADGALVASAEGQDAVEALLGLDPATRARRDAIGARVDSIVRAWRAGDWAPLHRAMGTEQPLDAFARGQAARLKATTDRLGALTGHAVLGTRPLRDDGMTTVRLDFERGAMYQRLGWEGNTIALFSVVPAQPGERFLPIGGGAYASADLRSGRGATLRVLPGAAARLVIDAGGRRAELVRVDAASPRTEAPPVADAPSAVERVMEGPPEELPASDPRARRAAAIAEPFLAGDRATVERLLAEHGAPGYAGSDAMRRDLDRLVPPSRARSIRLTRFLRGIGSDVVVAAEVDGAERTIAVRLETAAPHRVVGFADVRMRTGG